MSTEEKRRKKKVAKLREIFLEPSLPRPPHRVMVASSAIVPCKRLPESISFIFP